MTAQARAVDDAANIGTAASVTFTAAAQVCPCSIFTPATTGVQENDTGAVELGVKFRSDDPGFITGIRFYKTAGNTGTHTGTLWSTAGANLGTVTFAGESGTGWQEAIFDAPIAIDADTTYVASYHTNAGNYAIGTSFAGAGVDNPPLHALMGGVDGPNGVYQYGAGGVYPTATFGSSNYLVDVVFETTVGPDTTPPTIVQRSPAPNASGVAVGANVSTTFSEPMAAGSITGTTVELRGPSNALVPATVTYNAGTRTAVLDPSSALEYSTTYTATVKGGAGGVTDVADPANPLAADVTWSFTTAAPPPPPPDEGPGGPILVVSSAANPFSRYYVEILRNEGLNAFNAVNLSTVDATLLADYDVVILGEIAVDAPQAAMFATWVDAGGNLIAMRPDPDLAGLLGLTDAGTDLSDAYLQIDTGAGKPGAGLVDQTIQFHGTADRYTLDAGAEALATLYSSASTATANPAVTLRDVGSNGGQAAAFTYDLAKSVVYTRQGNPAWAGQERDGQHAADHPFGRHVLSGLDRLQQDPDPPGRRAAAPAGQPDRARQPRRDAAAAVLVLPARREGRRRDDRGRPCLGRHGRPVRLGELRQPGRVQRRRLGVRPADLVHLPEHGHLRSGRCGVSGAGIRDRDPRQHRLLGLDAELTRELLQQPARPARGELPEPFPAGHPPHALHHLERLGDAAEGRARPRDPPRHELLLLARRVGPGPARATSPAPACRCASPTSTDR